MPIEHRIRQLVEEALDSDRTPDEVCRSCPELLGEVRRQWERVRAVEAELDALFSPSLFIVGGGVSEKTEKFLPLIEGIRAPLVPAAEHNEAGIAGAALYAETQS